ncbi:unnamed protein product [Durusdinium trenchii]|uniref:SET domain-containing protein n=1 Tax=Durusdinium trenchii TaxID=1381693 RepID=A0ABP0P292_9DINO
MALHLTSSIRGTAATWVGAHRSRMARSQRSRRSNGKTSEVFQPFWEGFAVQPSWHERALDVAEVPGAGRGWVARRQVQKGELLLSIPRVAAIEVDMDEDMEGWEAELALNVLRRLDRLGPAADPRLRQKHELQALWQDYAKTFPEAPAGAAFWPQDAIITLGWPATVEQLLAYSQQIQESAQWVSGNGNVPRDAACWAVSAVITRSFAVDDEVRAMIPLADIFNHEPRSASSDVHEVAWSLEGDRFEVHAPQTVMPGEEVRICYGEESAAELLAVHGMVLPKNEADYLEVFESVEDLVAAVESICGAPRRDRLARLEVIPVDDLLVRPGRLEASEPLLRALQAMLCEDDELCDPGERRLRLVCSEERQQSLRLEALLLLAQILRGALRVIQDMPDAGSPDLAVRYRRHVAEMLNQFVREANDASSAGVLKRLFRRKRRCCVGETVIT